ncbi:MAG: tyrosine-type recombinase/integrase [Pseudomonadota bacterium]
MLGLHLGLHTGQREYDLITLPWSAFDGIGFSLTQSKTGRDVYVPCTEELLRVLDETPKRSTLIMTNTRGRPWTQDGFQTSWRKAAIKSGIQGRLRFNDLRDTTVTMLSEAGCTVPEIATITGHTLKSVDQILERYMSRTKVMATAAIVKLDVWRRTGEQQKL